GLGAGRGARRHPLWIALAGKRPGTRPRRPPSPCLPGGACAVELTLPQRLRRLPRETRDTLFLLAVIAWTVLPHLSHLPGWCIALTALMLAWRTQLALVNGPLPSRWWLVM